MSTELCSKQYSKLRANRLSKASTLRRKIRKTSRRKKKRRRVLSNERIFSNFSTRALSASGSTCCLRKIVNSENAICKYKHNHNTEAEHKLYEKTMENNNISYENKGLRNRFDRCALRPDRVCKINMPAFMLAIKAKTNSLLPASYCYKQQQQQQEQLFSSPPASNCWPSTPTENSEKLKLHLQRSSGICFNILDAAKGSKKSTRHLALAHVPAASHVEATTRIPAMHPNAATCQQQGSKFLPDNVTTSCDTSNAESFSISPPFISALPAKLSISPATPDTETKSSTTASIRRQEDQQLRCCAISAKSLLPASISLSSTTQSALSSSSSSSSAPSSSSPALSYVPRIMGHKLFRGLFMTLAVLSICNSNVLETSAASVRTSEAEIIDSTALMQMKVPAAPESMVAGPTTLRGLSSSRNNTRSPTSLVASSEGHPSHNNHHLQTTSLASTSSSSSAASAPSSLASASPPLRQQSFKDFRQVAEILNIAANKPTNTLMAPKQKRQQKLHQLPQYLTSTQETAFSPNGKEAVQNRSLQSLSIVDGRLTVPMDMDSQQQSHLLSNDDHATSGTSTGISSGGGGDGLLVDGNEVGMVFPKRHSMPVFDFGMPRNITARTGHMEAIIKCRVDRLDDKSVSWIRKRDLHILTVGKTTYTSDKRFQVTESKDSREWTLHVKSPQARDSGIYECQVNTEPKMSMAFQLNIIEISPDAKAVITGPADLYFKVGSAIILTCLVHQPSVKDIGPIHWYRGEYLITPFDVNDDTGGGGGGVDVVHDDFGTSAALTSKSKAFGHTDTYDSTADGDDDDEEDEEHLSQILTNEITQDFTQRIAMEQQLCDTIKSRLRISNAQKSDSGNYTCQPTTASSASVMVHVINDENPAAMQKSGAAPATSATYCCLSAAAGALVLACHLLRCGCWSSSRLM